MYALPPKPPPSSHDRVEHRRDNRNKRKNDKGGRHKANRDHQQRDSNYSKNPQNWKKEQNRQGHREHSKQPTTESANPDLEPVRGEQAQVEPQDIQLTRESDDHGETPKLQEPHDERVPDTAVEDSLSDAAAEQKPEDSITLHIHEGHDVELQIDQVHKEPLSQEQDKQSTPRPDDRKDSVGPSDPEPAASEVAVVTAADVQPKPWSPQYPSRPERAFPRATSVSPVRVDGERGSPIKKSHSDNALKRRRSEDDHDRDSSPGHARRHLVTESNLRSLERSHRHQSSNSGPEDSTRREHHDYYRSRRHRRAGSEDGSRQHSRRSSRSSRSSGLDSLEAELLGRPSKGRSDDSMEEQEKTSKAKRRRQNVDSAYR